MLGYTVRLEELWTCLEQGSATGSGVCMVNRYVQPFWTQETRWGKNWHCFCQISAEWQTSTSCGFPGPGLQTTALENIDFFWNQLKGLPVWWLDRNANEHSVEVNCIKVSRSKPFGYTKEPSSDWRLKIKRLWHSHLSTMMVCRCQLIIITSCRLSTSTLIWHKI